MRRERKKRRGYARCEGRNIQEMKRRYENEIRKEGTKRGELRGLRKDREERRGVERGKVW